MKTNAEVERCSIILGADRRMTEYVKYGNLGFGYDGDFATFVQASDKKQASLMFNRGARIPGKFPHLEGSHPSARFMRFANPAEAKARATELSKIVAAWGALTPTDRAPAKPKR